MHIAIHTASALPFLAMGEPIMALGCMLPDAVWLQNEFEIRRSSEPPLVIIKRFGFWRTLPYRLTHSLLLWAFALPYTNLAYGVFVHVALDIISHREVMHQMPLFPIPWRVPRWVSFY